MEDANNPTEGSVPTPQNEEKLTSLGTPTAEGSVPTPAPTPAPTETTPKSPTTSKKKSLAWLKWLLIGLGIAAVVGVGGFLGYKFLKSGNPQKPDMKLIPVCQKEKWGYIDHEGTFVINPQFKRAEYFSEGLAKVTNSKGKVGYINKDGEFVIPTKYIRGTHFNGGLAFVVEEGEAPVCIDKKGKEIFKLTQADGVMPFSEGLAAFYTINKKGEAQFGYVDKKGKVVITPQFKSATFFSEGLAIVGNSDGKYGYIDKKGKYVITPQFDNAGDFHDGLATVEQGNTWGVINKKGKYVVNPQYDYIGNYANGVLLIEQDEKYGFIDEKGKFVVNPQFDIASGFIFGESLSMVLTDDKCGFVDKKGKYVINPQFDAASWFVDGIAIVENGEKYGLINKKGEFIVNPQFDEMIVPMLDYNFIESDYYNCAEFFKNFMEKFDSQHIGGLPSGACMSDIDLPADITFEELIDQGGEIELNKELDANMVLASVSYDFSQVPYIFNDYYDFDINENATISSVTYKISLESSALSKSKTIAAKLTEKFKNLYNGRVIKGTNESKYAVLICSKNFYIAIWEEGYTIGVMAFFNQSEFKKIETDFHEEFDEDDETAAQREDDDNFEDDDGEVVEYVVDDDDLYDDNDDLYDDDDDYDI